jgi:hypothetical protein
LLMIKISDLKEGDFLMVNNEGAVMEGCVTAVDHAQKLAKISTGENNEFWYDSNALSAIPLSDKALRKLHFERKTEELNIKREPSGYTFIVKMIFMIWIFGTERIAVMYVSPWLCTSCKIIIFQ